MEVIQSNGSFFYRKTMLKIKRITFYLKANLKNIQFIILIVKLTKNLKETF